MIGAAIYGILSTANGVTSICSTRIYPDVAPQNAAYPFAIYTIEGADPSDTKDGVSKLDAVTFTVMSLADSYDTANNLAAAIRTALDAKAPGTYSGIILQSIRFSDQRSGTVNVDKHIYIVEQRYNTRVSR